MASSGSVVGNDPVNGRDPSGSYSCESKADCDAAKEGVKELKAARDYYKEAPIGSLISRNGAAASALGARISQLGNENDGKGPTITTGSLPNGQFGETNTGTNTITLNTINIAKAGSRIGETLAHETQHLAQKGQVLGLLAGEVRPFMMEYLVSRAPGGSFIGGKNLGYEDYLGYRLQSYCGALVAGIPCGPAKSDAIQQEIRKPF